MNKQHSFISNFKSNRLWVEILKVLVLGMVLLVSFFGMIVPQYSQGYTAALIDKVNRLESIEEPKIVLIGNSNLAFGIRSEMIEEAFGMPVVNMGLHGGIGNSFHEEMAKINLNPEDIIVICHTTYGDDGTVQDGVLTWTAIENHLKLWRVIPFKEWDNMIASFSTYAKKCIKLYLSGEGNKDAEWAYSRNAFNEYGDNVYNSTHKVTYKFREEWIPGVPVIGEECISRLNKLNTYITDQGATMVVAGYPIGYKDVLPDKEGFDQFEKELDERLDCAVISDFEDYFFTSDYIWDAQFHLTDEGARIRTEQLIEDLQKYLCNNLK